MALTTDTTLFASRAASCPATFMKVVNYNRTVDFGKIGLAASTNYELIALPKGFVAQYVTFKQTKAADAAVAVTVKDKTAGTNVAAEFTTSATGAKGGIVALSADDAVFVSGETLCLCTGTTVPAAGVVEIGVVGFQALGDSLDDVADGVPPYAIGQTDDEAAANKSGGDPMYRQPNAG